VSASPRAALAAHAPLGQLGEGLGAVVPCDQRLEHRPRRHPEHVRDDTGELDVRGLKDLLHPVGFPRAVLDQPLAVAHHVAQLTLRRGRHEAAAEQAEFQELGEPLAVPHVRLPARDHLDVLGVHEEQLEAPLEEVVDRPPVHASGLHRDMGAPGGGQPVHQVQQLPRRGPEGAHLVVASRRVAGCTQTGGHARLVYVEPATHRVQDVHGRPRFLRRAVRRSPRGRSYACCPAGGTQQSGVPGSAWVPIDDGLSGTSLQPTSTPSLHARP
jgi:hypothetical protein